MAMKLDALQLLREHSVVEVRDYDLEVSAQSAKLHDRFTDELRLHYGEILEVADAIGSLYEKLKESDSDFRDLCFKDDIYKLKKLEPMTDSVGPGPVKDPGIDIVESQKILLVSNWSLAVSDFVSRFAISSTSTKLFDDVVTQFGKLREDPSVLQQYHAVISSRCDEFLQYILDSPGANTSFNTPQWTHIYYLVLDEPQDFPWDVNKTQELERILFENVLEEPLEYLLKCSDEVVTRFVKSAVFDKKSKEKILRDIEMRFSSLEQLLSQAADETPTLVYPSSIHELDVTSVVESCQMHSMGLTTVARVDMYKIVKPLIQMLDSLKKRDGQADQVAELCKRLGDILERNIPTRAQEDASQHPRTMDELVDRITTDQNDRNASKLICSQITALRAL